VKLASLVCDGGSAICEDAAGLVYDGASVSAAWVLDGVTGINTGDVTPGPSDAAWFVKQVDSHLRELASSGLAMPDLLRQLVERLICDWANVLGGAELPAHYDLPATCLVFVRRYADGWKALRLGDSILLSERQGIVHRHDAPLRDLPELEIRLSREAARLRRAGATFDKLLQAFRMELLASRKLRNSPGHHSVLLPDRSALVNPEIIDLGMPQSILLCTDGFYRAVDTYGVVDKVGLVAACRQQQGMDQVLSAIRATEAADPECEKFPRFKPADDASAVGLVNVGVW
jgi:hypothetical protein